ncbi:MAG: hypothetical protein R3C41_04325 [Calditrichia bacterium]|nr:hypothetical protein [Calditrichota bacterium]MCB0267467.1 hypothetical protein [Calditrichota bacterium]MCB0286166.1 hypothetical protein [Calditrichota bacterium]MCB9067836.1 hypothetical protein [Calditrichia bacterium]
MADICINVPRLDEHQTIEVEVKINGEKKMYHYRVELFDWDGDASSAALVHLLQDKIANYDAGWQLYQIGAPLEKHIPVMFRQLGETH